MGLAKIFSATFFGAALIALMIGLAQADLRPINSLGDKVEIYTNLFTLDPLADLLPRDRIIAELKKGLAIEEATPNGGRTILEKDLINLGSNINEDRCSEKDLFPCLAWLKRRFSETPIIFDYLVAIENEQKDLCREQFALDYAMVMFRLNSKMLSELRKLTTKVASMGVYLNGAKDIPTKVLMNGLVYYVKDYRLRKDEIDLPLTDVIVNPDEPIKEIRTEPKVVAERTSLTLTHKESSELLNEFMDIYKKITNDCKSFTETVTSLMQVAEAVDEKVPDLEGIGLVCGKILKSSGLSSKVGELYLNVLNKERMTRYRSEVGVAPTTGKIKKSKFKSFKLKFHRSS